MFNGLLFFLKQGLKYDRCYVLWNVFFQVANAPIPVVASLIPKLIIDELTGQNRIGRLVGYIAILAGYTLLATVLSAYFRSDGFTRRCRVNAEFDSDLHRRLYECDYENLEDPRFLEMQEKAKKFLYCNRHGFGYLLDCALNICGHLLTLAGIAAIVATLHIWMILLFLILAFFSAAIESRVKKKIKRLDDQSIADQRGWTYYAGLSERMEYGKEFRIYHVGEWLLSKEREFFSRSIENTKKQNDAYIKSGIVTALFTFVQQCAAYGYLVYCVVSGEISIGSFMMYVSAITVFASAFRQVMSSLVEIRAYDMYYDNLAEYLSVPAKMRSGKGGDFPQGVPVIEFRNVSFRYRGSQHFALRNINIKINPGKKLLIVGENGSGKTTFIKLLLRLYDPSEGEILLDGVNIKNLDYEKYLSLFSAAFQDYRLFSFPLWENVAMGPTADRKRIELIFQKIGLEDMLAGLEKGLDTAVYKNFDEAGFEPSGGQGQKIAIARALYKDAPFIVLDEPTAALDPRSEYEIYQNLDELVGGKSAIYISHRLSSAKFCHEIAVFEDGQITEYGSHRELIDKGGKYASLFRMQADYYR